MKQVTAYKGHFAGGCRYGPSDKDMLERELTWFPCWSEQAGTGRAENEDCPFVLKLEAAAPTMPSMREQEQFNWPAGTLPQPVPVAAAETGERAEVMCLRDSGSRG
jgi:hypothetical protein